jgi:hypothetical protein
VAFYSYELVEREYQEFIARRDVESVVQRRESSAAGFFQG